MGRGDIVLRSISGRGIDAVNEIDLNWHSRDAF